jgi:PQQ-dependent catabolism-associated CXXCW motif protein
MDPNRGKFEGSIDSGVVNYHYQGSLVSATSRYSFTGTNAFADFVDLISNERFRAQMIVQGQQLLMIVNPHGPGPVQYLCQQSNAGGAQPGGIPQQPPRVGTPQQPGRGADLDRMMAIEREDFGVPATRQLHNGEMHGPTPNTIPGGQVVTTKGLVELVQKQPVPFVLIDTLGNGEMLPEAIPLPWASTAGSFTDQTQQRLVQLLEQGTRGNKDVVLVFYCLSRECWMSYNAALRAINAGYTNVLWYRGGIEAWKAAGLPTQSTRRSTSPGQK